MLKEVTSIGLLCLCIYGCTNYVKSDNAKRAMQQAALPPQERTVPNHIMLSSCQSFVKSRLPGPVTFNYFLSDTVEKPGETTWHTTFTHADRAYRLTCTVQWDGKVTGSFSAAG